MAALMVLTVVSWVGSYAQIVPPSQDGAERPAQAVSKNQLKHDCCPPHQQHPFFEAALPSQPAGMPCGGGHSCCINPAPESTPELPSQCARQRPVNHTRTVPLILAQPENTHASPASLVQKTIRDASQLSTVLRI